MATTTKATKSTKTTKVAKVAKAAKATVTAKATKATVAAKTAKATVAAKATTAAKAAKATVATKAAKATAAAKTAKATVATKTAKATAAAKTAKATVAAKAKTSTKTAKAVKPAAEKTCYSPEELQEFKELILSKIAKAEKDLELLQQAVAGSENDVSDTAPTFKTLEEGSNVLLKEENQKLAARQQKFIRDLRAALVRIENRTYGICQATGKLIPKERLMIVPHATMTVEAKEASKKRR